MWQPRPLSHPLTPTQQQGLGRAQGHPLAQQEGRRTCTTHKRLTPSGPGELPCHVTRALAAWRGWVCMGPVSWLPAFNICLCTL